MTLWILRHQSHWGRKKPNDLNVNKDQAAVFQACMLNAVCWVSGCLVFMVWASTICLIWKWQTPSCSGCLVVPGEAAGLAVELDGLCRSLPTELLCSNTACLREFWKMCLVCSVLCLLFHDQFSFSHHCFLWHSSRGFVSYGAQRAELEAEAMQNSDMSPSLFNLFIFRKGQIVNDIHINSG